MSDILTLFSTLRSDLLILASNPAVPGDYCTSTSILIKYLVQQGPHNLIVLATLQAFLLDLTRLRGDVAENVLRFLTSLPRALKSNRSAIINAFAKLVSLPEPVEEDHIWRAVNLLLSLVLDDSAQTPPRTVSFPSASESAPIPASVPTFTPPSPRAPDCFVTPHKGTRHPQTGALDDTPVHANTGSLNFSQMKPTHALVDPYLRAELRDSVYANVSGFHSFFPGITKQEWDCAVKCPLGAVCACLWGDDDQALSGIDPFPSQKGPPESLVVAWFKGLNQHLSIGHRTFCSSGTKGLDHSSSDRRCDIFLSSTSAAINGPEQDKDTSGLWRDGKHSWMEVLVPGELKSASGEDGTQGILVQLASYAREVFGAQINRRFVHAFTICGSLFRCYLFDRAGVSISHRFDIQKNEMTQRLVSRILLGYTSMTPEQLGFDTNYIGPDGCPFMPTRSTPMPTCLNFAGRQFTLSKYLFHRPVIVSRGTLCWLAKDETGDECVIKDSWRARSRIAEGEFLSIAASTGAWGVPKPLAHGDVNISGLTDSIGRLRFHLSYLTSKSITITDKHDDGMYWLSSVPQVTKESSAATAAVNPLKRPSVTDISSEKRKLPKLDQCTPPVPTERSQRSAERITRARSRQIREATTTAKLNNDKGRELTSGATCGVKIQSTPPEVGGTTQTKAMKVGACSADINTTPASSRVIPMAPKTPTSPDVASPMEPPGTVFTGLTHSILVSKPVGKKIEQFTSIQELLEAFRDAIRCHQSLVEHSGILHRDVSPNNIMISKHSSTNDPNLPKGFLIDLDLAKQINLCPKPARADSAPRRRTGTMLFMAIEVLNASALHTWRHDLESFLYVLIWICVTADKDPGARAELTQAWSAKAAADKKTLQMSQHTEFKYLLGLFAPNLLESPARIDKLVAGFRNVLFPTLTAEYGIVTCTGTLEDREKTYHSIISLFNESLAALADGTK